MPAAAKAAERGPAVAPRGGMGHYPEGVRNTACVLLIKPNKLKCVGVDVDPSRAESKVAPRHRFGGILVSNRANWNAATPIVLQRDLRLHRIGIRGRDNYAASFVVYVGYPGVNGLIEEELVVGTLINWPPRCGSSTTFLRRYLDDLAEVQELLRS